MLRCTTFAWGIASHPRSRGYERVSSPEWHSRPADASIAVIDSIRRWIMSTLTIRGLDDETHARLRVQAAQHGRSMEAEVRAILQASVAPPPTPRGLGSRIHARFAGLGEPEFELPARNEPPRAADFDS